MDTKKLRQKILDLAIRGKLVPQDPNDEPASVLLERIRAEKEHLIKEGKIKRTKKSNASDTSHYENVPFELPEGWCWGNLINLCHIFGRIGFRGYTKEDLVTHDGAITLSPSNIIEGKMNYNSCTYISWNKYDESPEIQIQENDILLVKTGSSYGKCALVEKLPKQATINPQFVVLKHISCNPEYLTYVLQSKYAQNNYEKFVLGTAIPTFTQVALGNMQIPIPPLTEQNRIVKEIKRLLGIIESLESNKKHLQDIVTLSKSKILEIALSGKLISQNTYDEPAIEVLKRINPSYQPCDNRHYENVPFKVPETWVWARGKELFLSMSNCKPSGDYFKYIDIDSIDNKNCVIKSPKILPVISAPSRATRYTRIGDVLFSMVRPYLKNIAMVTEDNCIASSGFYVCSPNESLISKYCYYLMISPYVVNGLTQFMKGDNSPSINHVHINEWLYPIPPLNEQNRIVQKVDKLFRYLDSIAIEL